MHKAMIVALAVLAALLVIPLPGSARESRQQGFQPQGSYSRQSASPGSFQRGTHAGGFSSQRSGTRQGEFRGVQPRAGYQGTYPRSGYRSSGYRSGGHYYGGYPRYRSNVYFSGGVWVGPGWYSSWGWPYYYPYYYPYYNSYYSSPPVVIEQAPTEYIEKGQESDDSNYLYHCSDPEGYYPTIQRCPSGWAKEAPSSPPDQ
jgi:hypothetical protein